jgi:hypothetical protein
MPKIIAIKTGQLMREPHKLNRRSDGGKYRSVCLLGVPSGAIGL